MLAEALMKHAARVMPRELAPWAEAMRNELEHVDDSDALAWAVGCLHAAHVARIRSIRLLDAAVVRFGGALLAVFLAFDALLPTALTLAYRLGALGAAERLGSATAGDDYRRLVPLIEAIPPSIHVLAVFGGACYLAALGYLLRRRRAAYVALVLGVGAYAVSRVLVQPIVASVGVAGAPGASALAVVVVPVVLPLLLALAAWSGSRTQSSRPPIR
jgi:hypothetical protein